MAGCTASAKGPLKDAAAPTPFAEPTTPNAPAMVVSTPLGASTRTEGPLKSAMKSDAPSGAHAMPEGPLCVLVPRAPSAPPAPAWPERTADARPATETLNSRPQMASATMTWEPEGEVRTLQGWVKAADVPTPAAQPGASSAPARVLTTHCPGLLDGVAVGDTLWEKERGSRRRRRKRSNRRARRRDARNMRVCITRVCSAPQCARAQLSADDANTPSCSKKPLRTP